MLNKVHCHICPLKECCSYACAQASWRLQQFFLDHLSKFELGDNDWSRVERATMNCPLRKCLEK